MWQQSIAEGLFKAPWTDDCFILTLTRQLRLPPFLCGNTDPKWSMWVTATNGTTLLKLMCQYYCTWWENKTTALGLMQWNAKESKLTVRSISQSFADFSYSHSVDLLSAVGVWGRLFALSSPVREWWGEASIWSKTTVLTWFAGTQSVRLDEYFLTPPPVSPPSQLTITHHDKKKKSQHHSFSELIGKRSAPF